MCCHGDVLCLSILACFVDLVFYLSEMYCFDNIIMISVVVKSVH